MKPYIPKVISLPNVDEMWREKSEREPLPFRTRRCHDCAIEFYGEMVDELRKQPRQIQVGVASSWFCHNTCTHACKGAVDVFRVTDDKRVVE